MSNRNAEFFEQAAKVIPGGVNSPVRAFGSVDGTPPFIARAAGTRVYDEDGNEYLDYVGSWGPMILGHARPEVIEAVRETATRGLSFGAPTRAEIELAERVTGRVPGVDMLRLVNSGTEATMSALRLARAATGRDSFIKFTGCYHGHGDAFLVQAGSGAATFGVPNSPGVPEAVVRETLVAEYNDLAEVEALLTDNEVAAVIVEPVAGNMGLVPPDPGFLEGLRALTSKYGALLIFDEVMTGFRLAYGGASERFGVTADLVTLGKIIGGGMPIGAYGGRRDLMEQVAPSGPVYQAGTLSGNPVAVAAGLVTLDILLKENPYGYLEELGARLEAGVQATIDKHGYPASVQRVGAMSCVYFHTGPVRNWSHAAESDTKAFGRYSTGMIKQGIYLAPSQFEAGFLSSAHTEADIDRTLTAGAEAMAEAFGG